MKALPTHYAGIEFRSRLEARWAMIFQSLGLDWQYEPEGFDLGDGVNYLPDFLVRGADRRGQRWEEWVEVKGRMTETDLLKACRAVHPVTGFTDNVTLLGRTVARPLFISFIDSGDRWNVGIMEDGIFTNGTRGGLDGHLGFPELIRDPSAEHGWASPPLATPERPHAWARLRRSDVFEFFYPETPWAKRWDGHKDVLALVNEIISTPEPYVHNRHLRTKAERLRFDNGRVA